MAVTLTNPYFPHFAEISRTVTTTSPPFEATATVIWSGAADCQVNIGGGTSQKDAVFVSDYVIYTPCIDVEILTGDAITVTLREGFTPYECTIKQSTTEDVWEENGVKYGTTIWANRVYS